ncbi:transposase [Streptomyces olivaceoviridis]
MLCGDGPVRSLAELSFVGEHRSGHGGLYAALARGRVDTGRPRRALAAVPLPRSVDGRLVPAIDITCWLRPDAMLTSHRSGSCVTPTAGAKTSTSLSLAGRARSSAHSSLVAVTGPRLWTRFAWPTGTTPPPSQPGSCVTCSTG